MSEKQYRVGKAALMAPLGGRLMGAARLLPPGSRIPDNVFSKRKLAEHQETGAIVEDAVEVPEDAVEAPEDEQPIIETAPKDGFMDGPQIENGDTKLADLAAKQLAAKEEAEALGLTKDGEPVKEPEVVEEPDEPSGPVGEVMSDDGAAKAAEAAKAETKGEDSAKAETKGEDSAKADTDDRPGGDGDPLALSDEDDDDPALTEDLG